MAETHARRRTELARKLVDDKIDAALVTSLVNVRYLTGLDSSNAALLLTADGSAVLATDSRYSTAAKAVAEDVELVVERGVATSLAARAAKAGGSLRLGVEEHAVTLELWEAVQGALDAEPAAVETVHLGRAVEQLRAVKDEEELGLLAEACGISCRALEDLYAAGGFAGRTEKEIARDLEWRMFGHGADAIAFETIVASGPNSAIPHHRPTERVVERGELLKIDFGGAYRGYHADCTRTSVVGAQPQDWQREIYDLVAAAQRAGTEAVAVGAECMSVDRASRAIIDDAGYKENFGHGTGHGVGLEVHEAPTLGYSATGTLADRMAVTVEPGIYLPGRGGVRIEDTLAVRASGGSELLTPTTKDLLVLDA
ncbi:aminopeptidase P family protein [Jiangella aurantiaca]|uniref:Aminopeptidase P family protein n=1 Tax=Jiangella aurantiaca TaxID=2530373 RepID=A0A4R5AMY4_9ACTN|nr:Xaa-Pro peptidase family protein [Jiangella aurantiaca]TDD71592.1 aminopeptidase P family protein [Jiangella aurantiaca]